MEYKELSFALNQIMIMILAGREIPSIGKETLPPGPTVKYAPFMKKRWWFTSAANRLSYQLYESWVLGLLFFINWSGAYATMAGRYILSILSRHGKST